MIAGWRGGQIATVAASLVVGVLALRSDPSVAGILVAVLTAGAGVAFAFWPVLGRTAEQWLPLAVRWLVARASGDGRQHAPDPGYGHRVTVHPAPGPRRLGSVTGPESLPGRPGAKRSVLGGAVLESLPFGPAAFGRPTSGPSSTTAPGPPPPCWPSRATASPCSARPIRTPASRPGPGCSRPWPARGPTCTGSSGSNPASPTTAARCGTTGPPMPPSVPTPRPAVPIRRSSTRQPRPPDATACCWPSPSTRRGRRDPSGRPAVDGPVSARSSIARCSPSTVRWTARTSRWTVCSAREGWPG